MKVIIVLLVAVIFSFDVHCQTKDSLKIVSLFSDLLTHPEDKAQLTNELDKIRTRNKKNQKIEVTYLFNWSKFLLYSGDLDSSTVISNKGLSLFDRRSKNFEQVRFLNLIASVYSLQQKNKKAIKLFKKSLAISELNNEHLQAAYIKNNIANLFLSMLDYKSAYEYVRDAYETLKAYPEDLYLPSITSILSVAELKLGKLEQARVHGYEALKLAEKQSNVAALIVANYSLGEIELNAKNLDKSEAYFLNSLELSKKFNQQHYILVNNIGLMNLNFEKKSFSKAIEFGETALELASIQKNKNITYSIKKHLAFAYAGLTNYKRGYKLMESAHAIFLQSNDRETQNSINDILVKYDTEKKEKEIAKNKLLLLQKEVESTRLIIWVSLLAITLIILVVLLIAVRTISRNRLNRLKIEKEREVLNAIIEGEELERERLASELHDGLASVLTAAKYRVESLKSIDFEDQNELLGVLSNAQIETRRIAHNLAPVNLLKHGLIGALRQFSKENSTSKIVITFNANEAEVDLSKENSLLIYRVTQELVQNALKHAAPSQIDVQVMIDKFELRLTVEDDGVGFDSTAEFLSNGLLNINYRAQKIGGEFEINSSINGAGTVALFSLPLIHIN
jgi:two-component system NarL family sensor kinase